MTNRSNPYRAGGTFSGPSYTERKADKDLLKAIQQNQRYPYVLAPRQSGKSSLITHVCNQLGPPEFRTAFIDVSIFEPRELSDFNRFQDRFFSEWHGSLRVSMSRHPAERFLERVEQLLELCTELRLVTFLDEIDALLPSEFKDTFFSILRNTFNERASAPELARIQFVLAGAAQPEELIADRLRSPFNVGESIVLDELSMEETVETCTHLAKASKTSAEKIAQTVHYYASGSVYLTQLILERLWNRAVVNEVQWLSEAKLNREVKNIVDDIVARAGQDIHFKNIEASFHSRKEAVTICRKLGNHYEVTPSERQLLWFTGLSPREGRQLYRNRIYEKVFENGGPLDLRLPSVSSFFDRDEQLRSAVFISYRQTDDEQRHRVRSFGERLRNCGIDVVLDQFFLDTNPGGPNVGWDKWSSDRVLQTDYVLIVGTQPWFQCFEKTQQPGTGLGAACEADDLRHRIYEAGGVIDDIRIVLFDDVDGVHIPR
jgi:hypothetical protein